MSSQMKLVVALNLLMVFFWISPYSLAGEIPDLLLVFFTTVFSLKIVLRIRRERLPIRKAMLYYLATVPSMVASGRAIGLMGFLIIFYNPVFPIGLLLFGYPDYLFSRGTQVAVVTSPDKLKAVYVYQKSKSGGFDPDEEYMENRASFWVRYRYIPFMEKQVDKIVETTYYIRDYSGNKNDYYRDIKEIPNVQWIDRDRIIIDHTGEVILP